MAGLPRQLSDEYPVSLRAIVGHEFEYHVRPAAVTIRVGGPTRVLSIAVNSRFQDSGDVAPLIAIAVGLPAVVMIAAGG